VDDLVSRLKGRGIFVKDVSNQLGRGYIRITIGDRVSNNLLINAIRDIIG
jgi:histidinol-phosphate/aromatic aminotransferase/cobyric acid decarboxylase-like protein